MKKFKKLTASLMALAITAAGMSSIPASAAYGCMYSKKYIEFPGTYKTADAEVFYVSNQWYTARTDSIYTHEIFERKVNGYINHSNGKLYAPNGYSYNGVAYMSFASIPSDVYVTRFHSEHHATYHSNVRPATHDVR